MKIGVMRTAMLTFLVAGMAGASTIGLSTGVTGATNPATSEVVYTVRSNSVFELIAVLPVVSTVTGAPASMAASVNVPNTPFNVCGSGSQVCSNDMWAAQWTILSAPAGIQVVAAYQGSTVRLVNSTASPSTVGLRCQVGQMTGTCIFVTRQQPIADPAF